MRATTFLFIVLALTLTLLALLLLTLVLLNLAGGDMLRSDAARGVIKMK